ncbi:IclR family transcriptional regulator [Propionicicella superfundia]|uniref:IclR family transcriptional regulator n=1 Tax=Propionicicella superfundia TaxID=348582 RepID=UPI000401C2B4|nr:IclR family transcriptional regulator [Propionicicella superfundia]
MSSAAGDSAHNSKTVDRALRLLSEVAVAPSGLSLSASARRVGLPVSTAARLLKSLESGGFLVRTAANVYKAGPAVLQIGAIALANFEIVTMAEPHLRQLADYTGETAYLATPRGQDAATYLKQVESPRAIRHATWVGRAIGTAGTALGAALEGRVNQQGFAMSRATAVEPDATAAAAPVIDSGGDIVAAISIIGPAFRIDDAALHDYGEQVAEHARLLSEQLRLLPPQASHLTQVARTVR